VAACPRDTDQYRGRFAPSPTGPLHLGSLLAAVVSYVRARQQGGRWLLRIEDIDKPRVAPGAADAILRSLDAHGLEWHEEVCWQSRRLERYEATLNQLSEAGSVYPCSCTRQEIRQRARTGLAGPVYPGTCRDGAKSGRRCAQRFRIAGTELRFSDYSHGLLSCDPAKEVGDVIVKRRDGLFAYLLASTVDDADSGVTEIVRGDDILGFTPAQICLQQVLSLPQPHYAHFAVLRGADGRKLSKQNGAPAVDDRQPARNLVAVLRHIGMDAPSELARATPAEVWSWVDQNPRPPLVKSREPSAVRPISDMIDF